MYPRYIICYAGISYRALISFNYTSYMIFFPFFRPSHGHIHTKKTLHIGMIAVGSVVGRAATAVRTA